MFYYKDGWKPYEKKVTYTETVTAYENDTAQFQGKDNLTVTDLTLTDEQLARLEVIRHEDMSLRDVIEYVMNGVIESEKIERADKANRQRKAFLSAIDLTTVDPKILKESDLAKDWEPDAWMDGLVKRNDKLYIVNIPHRSQPNYAPEIPSALFSPLLTSPDGTPQPWVRPDSQNYYRLGDKVTHNGKTWESMNDVNTWEPGAPGVDERIWREVP